MSLSMKRKAAISAEAQMSELVSAPQSRAAAVKKSQSKGKKVKKVKVTVRKDFATEVEEDGNRVMLMEPLDAILSTTVSVTPQYDPSVSVIDTNVVDVIA